MKEGREWVEETRPLKKGGIGASPHEDLGEEHGTRVTTFPAAHPG